MKEREESYRGFRWETIREEGGGGRQKKGGTRRNPPSCTLTESLRETNVGKHASGVSNAYEGKRANNKTVGLDVLDHHERRPRI